MDGGGFRISWVGPSAEGSIPSYHFPSLSILSSLPSPLFPDFLFISFSFLSSIPFLFLDPFITALFSHPLCKASSPNPTECLRNASGVRGGALPATAFLLYSFPRPENIYGDNYWYYVFCLDGRAEGVPYPAPRSTAVKQIQPPLWPSVPLGLPQPSHGKAQL